MAKKIKVTTTNNSYKILVEYNPTTVSAGIKIRNGHDIYKQLMISLHSLSGIRRVIDEKDDIQTLMMLTGLSVLKTYLEDNNLKSPDLFTNGSFRSLNDKTLEELNKKGEE